MTDNDDDNRAIGIDGKPSELKSLINNDRPLNEILREQCKYEHPKAPAHILVTFTMQFDKNGNRLESIAEWSLILDDDANTPIIEDQITPISIFDKMVENWERKGYETTVCR